MNPEQRKKVTWVLIALTVLAVMGIFVTKLPHLWSEGLVGKMLAIVIVGLGITVTYLGTSLLKDQD